MIVKLPNQIPVHTKKQGYMQRISDYVRSGHCHYVTGTVHITRAFNFHDKLITALPIYNDKLKASRARAKGEPTARMLFWRPKLGEELHWIVLLHSSLEMLPPSEKWRHALVERIELTGYELIRQPRKNQEKPVWTWRYRTDRYADLRESLIQAIRSRRDHDAQKLIATIWGTAGFSGSRHQAKQLLKLTRSEWKRHRKNDEILEIPPFVGYVRRLADQLDFFRRDGKWVSQK